MQDEVRARAQNSQISKKNDLLMRTFFENHSLRLCFDSFEMPTSKNGQFQGFFRGGILLQIVIRPINIIPRNLACFRPRARLVLGFH